VPRPAASRITGLVFVTRPVVGVGRERSNRPSRIGEQAASGQRIAAESNHCDLTNGTGATSTAKADRLASSKKAVRKI
jgi:hypothetical protein